MDRQSPVINIVSDLAKQVEQLRVHDTDDKVESIICVGDNNKQCRPLSPQLIKLQFIITCKLPKLCNIKRSKPCTA